MCRWLAYSGSPIPIETFVSKPRNSLIHQSKESAMGATAINADGFGVGRALQRLCNAVPRR